MNNSSITKMFLSYFYYCRFVYDLCCSYNNFNNIQNKPIKLTKRVGIPAGVLPAPSLTRKQLEQPAQVRNNDSANTYRSSKETAEERRLRKQAIKEERKVGLTGKNRISNSSTDQTQDVFIFYPLASL